MSDDNVIDMQAHREAQEDLSDCAYVCPCGCGIFRLWADGRVECLNCGSILSELRVIDEEPHNHAS